MSANAHIIGWGKYVPSQVLTNDELAQIVDTSDEWIYTRTGIRERHIAAADEATATMAIQAARSALQVAGLRPTQIDLIIVATITPDHPFPATACAVQDGLGARHAAAFDLSAGCSGFVYGLGIAADLIRAGTYQTVLVIGAETLSRITDWGDRSTCVLFGDGAGAVLLQADSGKGGVLSSVMGSDGSGGDVLMMPAGGSLHPATHETVAAHMHFLQMRGREVFRFAVRQIPIATRRALEMAGLGLSDVRLIVPHQANQRIIEAAARALDVSDDLFFSNLAAYGNTSAASIPIALCEAVEQGRIQRDDVVVCVGFGAGLTWAVAVLRWTMPLPGAPPSRWRAFGYRIRWLHAAWRSAARRFVRWLLARWSVE
ncbi:MAG: ketoacyl-ACP synthase III [Anaerolineales bacterium]|nr:ketoacyl-ACP synthase III [Anaerolineales bacterium]